MCADASIDCFDIPMIPFFAFSCKRRGLCLFLSIENGFSRTFREAVDDPHPRHALRLFTAADLGIPSPGSRDVRVV